MTTEQWKFEQIKLIYDSAKFRTGFYVAAIMALVAAMTVGDAVIPGQYRWPFIQMLLCFMAAGICGAVIVTSILDAAEGRIWQEQGGDARHQCIKRLRLWIWWEHRFLWFGLSIPVVAIIVYHVLPLFIQPPHRIDAAALREGIVACLSFSYFIPGLFLIFLLQPTYPPSGATGTEESANQVVEAEFQP